MLACIALVGMLLAAPNAAAQEAGFGASDEGYELVLTQQQGEYRALYGVDSRGLGDGVQFHFTLLDAPSAPTATIDGTEHTFGDALTVRNEREELRDIEWRFPHPGNYEFEVTVEAEGAAPRTAHYTWVVGEPMSAKETSAPPRGAVFEVQRHAQFRAEEHAESCVGTIAGRIKDDRSVPAEWKNPADLRFGLGDAAKQNLPQDIGPVKAGRVWMIGSTQQSGVPWLGANTQHPSLLEHTNGEVKWELVGFEGPGAMVVFTQGGLGQVVGEEWFRASGGSHEGSHTIAANTHVHPSWVFSEPGDYTVTIRQSTTAKDGQRLVTDVRVQFEVGGSGNANDGHFDLGTIFEPGSCAPAAAKSSSNTASTSSTSTSSTSAKSASSTTSTTSAKSTSTSSTTPATTTSAKPTTREGDLAETGPTSLTVPLALAGVGLSALGAGLVRGTWRPKRWAVSRLKK